MNHRHLRPEGPAFSSHVREGVGSKLSKSAERRRCGTSVRSKEVSALRASLDVRAFLSTPSRTWLLNAGPSGLLKSIGHGPFSVHRKLILLALGCIPANRVAAPDSALVSFQSVS